MQAQVQQLQDQPVLRMPTAIMLPSWLTQRMRFSICRRAENACPEMAADSWRAVCRTAQRKPAGVLRLKAAQS